MCTKHQGCCSETPTQKAKPTHQCCDNHQQASSCCSQQSTSQCGCEHQGSHSSADPNQEDDDPDPSSSTLLTHTWHLLGMDCPSCARKIESAVSRVRGVEQAQVLFATEKLVVKTEYSGLEPAVEQAITQSGFSFSQTVASSQTNNTSFSEKIKQYQYIISLSAAMLLGFVLNPLLPNLSHWLFFVTCLVGLYPIGRKALQLALSGTPFAIESLMTVAALGALYLGETAEAGMVLVLFLIGEELEGFAATKARSGVKALMALVPENATKWVDGERVDVAVASLQPGDRIEVAPGGRLPADGQLVTSSANVDESALTGESVPVEKLANDKVMAGTVIVDKVVEILITSKQGQNAIDRILHMIEEADTRKAPIERFLDRFSRWYTPLMMLVALLVVLVPPLLFAQAWDTWVYRGLATLLIACPCALVISTPAAITSGLAAASRHGALIKGGAALEQLGSIERIAFDKTGTLTLGKPQVTDIEALNDTLNESQVLRIAAGVEQGSRHPLAVALVNHAQAQQADIPVATEQQALVGRGVQALVEGQRYQLIAPSKLTVDHSHKPQFEVLEAQGKTLAVLADENQTPLGLVAWQDQIRDDAAAAVQALKAMDIQAVMLTGDNPVSAKALSEQMGIDYQANLLPEDKVRWIESMSSSQRVAMVGDGINDAPAMKASHIGVAMGGGSDVALETADAALTHNRLIELANVIDLSKATSRNIRQNVSLALGLKAVFLVTSLLGITGLWLAVLADSGATALVTVNALRLLRYKAKYHA